MRSFDSFTSSTPGQNGRHFADDIFRCVFVYKMFCIILIFGGCVRPVTNCAGAVSKKKFGCVYILDSEISQMAMRLICNAVYR